MMPIVLEILTGSWNLTKMGFSFIGKFLASLNAQGVVGLMVAILLSLVSFHEWSDARHWHKQSNQFEKLYRIDENSFVKIAAKANSLRDSIAAVSQGISSTLKANHDAQSARIDTDSRALFMRGPGKAACGNNPSTSAVASGRDQAPPATGPATAPVPSADRAAVPWDWIVQVVTEHDQLLNDDSTYRLNSQKQRQAWEQESRK